MFTDNSIICDSPKFETTQITIKSRIEKQLVIQSCHGILNTNENESVTHCYVCQPECISVINVGGENQMQWNEFSLISFLQSSKAGDINPWCQKLGLHRQGRQGSDWEGTQREDLGADDTFFPGLAAGYISRVFPFMICHLTICMLCFNKYVC